MNNSEDIDQHFPGLLEETKRWLRVYKIPEGKPENVLAFDGKTFDKKTAFEIIDKCETMWKKLMKGEVPPSSEKYSISVANVTVSDSKYAVGKTAPVVTSIPKKTILEPAPLPAELCTWHYINKC